MRLGTAVLVLVLSSVGCSLPRAALGVSPFDGGIGPMDAFAPRDSGVDAPGHDAFGERDAFTSLDAPITPNDAAIVPDAFVVRDAGHDAYVPPPDAWTDPCTTGPDADGDGVHDACDRCPGHDDHVDVDGDGTPDGCDSWPCGAAAPAAPPTSVTVGSVSVSNVAIAGMGTVAVVDASASIDVGLAYSISECTCTGCIDQIEIGWSPGSRQFCAYDANPGCRTVSTGVVTHTATTPASHGIYEMRFHLAQDFACGRSSADWYGGPPTDGMIAYVCVR